jgi:DNA-binding response OmpR family regulator
MVVEDEKDLLTIVQRHLEKWGFTIAAFQDSMKALESFKENPYEFSLILSDVRMPVLDGIHLAKQILETRADAKIMMMTAFDIDDKICSDLHSIRKEDVIHKPFRLAAICEAVKKQLAAS